jgi:hypothetical protein
MNATITLRTDLAKATDSETSRYALGGVAVSVDADGVAYAAATDGRILAVTPIDHAGEAIETVAKADTPSREFVLIPAGILKRPTPNKPNLVTLNGRAECKGRVGDYLEGRFPRLGDAIPAMQDRVTLSIDAKLLAKLAEAINTPGANVVTLLLDPNKPGDSPIGVLPSGETSVESFGLLMPCGKGEEADDWYAEKFNDRARAFKQSIGERYSC